MAAYVAALGLTVALFVAVAAFQDAQLLGEGKMGALFSGFVGLSAIGIGRLLGMSREAAGPDRPETPGAVAEKSGSCVLGAQVDGFGCSLVQFCGGIDVNDKAGRGACNSSDWSNDEPGDEAEDCRARQGECVPLG